MVNATFRAASIYGFEMVDARVARTFHAIIGHQSKIYAESIHSGFRKNFGDFISMQILAIYRRLLIRNKAAVQPQHNQKRRPGSRDVFSASHGILARAGARAAAEGKDA
jgi:hypothetical protein